jgi:AcrR family transcriptional regulator
MAPRPREIRTPDRAATERALERATLDLLDRNGVLAGLNLREVADEAGVNRGLVYHYFGSRRDLLRAALRSDVGERMRDLREGTGRPMRERYASFFRTMLHHRRAVVLSALLVLDGDDRVRLDVDPEGRRGRFAREVANRELPSDVDGDAHWVALSSMIYGYSVFRRRFADEMGIDLAELDERVLGATDRLLAAVEREAQADAAPDAASATG